MADGGSLYVAMGPEYTLLRLDAAIDVAPLVAAAEQRGVPLKILELQSKSAAIDDGSALILSRPDQVVAWRSKHPPADPLALIDRARGAARQPVT
jgi:hypothetical protein